jgi:hypothetical protein
MSVIVPISSALYLKADVAAVGRESPKLTLSRLLLRITRQIHPDHQTSPIAVGSLRLRPR